LVNKDCNERFKIINRRNTSNNKTDDISIDYLNYDLDEMEPIGDCFLSAAIAYDSPPELKRKIIAALKTHILGNNSIDYILKKYGNLWEFSPPSKDEIEFHRLLRTIKSEVKLIIKQNSFSFPKAEHLGLLYAEATLFRIKGSFRSATLLISKGYPIESISICRLILEQISWAYSIHKINDIKKIMSIKSNKAISILKNLLPEVGGFYGWLNIITHIDQSYSQLYCGFDDNDNMVIKYDIPELKYISIHCLLRLADIFRIVSEYILWQFMEKIQAWQKDENGKLMLREKRPLTGEILKLTRKLIEETNFPISSELKPTKIR
jgi:hypothetical protein